MESKFQTVIGLEVHLQLLTLSKMFCGCSTQFGNAPNTQTCPVCIGLPGSLPVLNKKTLEYAIKVGIALNCKIHNRLKFDRKNYFYPDLSKNYQISQYQMPVATDGFIYIKDKKIGIKRVHLEEDTGKLFHEGITDGSLIDFNRSGIPLLEIVSFPSINSASEAYQYLTELKMLLKYLDVSDCDMEKGSLRCDANISIMPTGATQLGTKVEIKNMNSFKNVERAMEFETKRQIKCILEGQKIIQETRLYDPDKNITLPMRTKEESHDYRYFPDPDLVPFTISIQHIQEIKNIIPELPHAKKKRFVQQYNITEYDAGVLTSDNMLAEYFEKCASFGVNSKYIANWMMGDLLSIANQKGKHITDLKLEPEKLSQMIQMIEDGRITGKVAKDVLIHMIEKGKFAIEIVQEHNLEQVQDRTEIEKWVKEAIQENKKSVSDYLSGKNNAFMFLVGQVIKKSKGKANPNIVHKILTDLIKTGESPC
ncbi:glutaminyl-tRNA synthase (glutamine-hydrolyzing) subunit B [bacterium Unc6]|nr:glutaminyl-tRNA synthase (glutamine-hydrolyzing) subunit B [bacterium Unc6]